MGFYRNCYEKSIKTPNEKILQFLSCECISAFVQLINNSFDSFVKFDLAQTRPLKSMIKFNKKISFDVQFDGDVKTEIQTNASNFLFKFKDFFNNLSQKFVNLDFSMKKFALSLIESNRVEYLSSIKFYSTSYFALHYLIKKEDYFGSKEETVSYYVSRASVYSEPYGHKNDEAFKLKEYYDFWLINIFSELCDFKKINQQNIQNILSDTNPQLNKQLNFISRQIDASFNVNSSLGTGSISNQRDSHKTNDVPKLEFVKNLLKSTWIYLIDVLTGYLLETNLTNLEQILFFSSNNNSSQVVINNNTITDLSFILVTFKSCLDSLYQIISILSYLPALDKELGQLFYILVENSFLKNAINSELCSKLSLNQLICIDFVLYANTNLLYNSNETLNEFFHANNKNLLWKHLIETYFFSSNLQSNIDQNLSGSIKISRLDPEKRQRSFIGLNRLSNLKMLGRKSIFRSTQSTDDETIELDVSASASATLPHSISVDASLNAETRLFKVKYQQEIILKSLFLFLNKNGKIPNNDSQSGKILNSFTKSELVDLITLTADQFLNGKFLTKTDEYLLNEGKILFFFKKFNKSKFIN